MKNFFSKQIILSIFLVGVFDANNLQVVDHKNAQLKLYLDAIQYNVQEKIGILPYILQKKSGIYLEIGTGGDPIAELIEAIPSNYPVEIIASDVDQNVLDAILLRHLALKEHVQFEKYPYLHLKQLNAIDMSSIPNNYLDGINASSVVHEIISYAGGYDGCKKFFQEAHRVLKNDGILIYRDPEFVAHEKQLVTVQLNNKPSRLFAHIFLYKFLDDYCSVLAQHNNKFFMYDSQDVHFICYKKGEPNCCKYAYKEYLQIPSYDVDFSRKYAISLPYGLYRELSRHYLTYLHACNPLVYVKAIPHVTFDNYAIHYWAHSTKNIVKNFLIEFSENLHDEYLTFGQKILIDNAIEKNCEVLEFGIPLRFISKAKKIALRTLLKEYGFDPYRYIISVNNEITLLDYRIFGMFYDQIKGMFDNDNTIEFPDHEKHAYWLKREGEEYYFYYSVDALLSQVLLFSLEEEYRIKPELGASPHFYDTCMVLCPCDKEHNIFLNRQCYSELLKDTLEVFDGMNYPLEVFDGKRIIHFKKTTLSQAIEICEAIIKTDPLQYVQLTKTIDTLKKNEGRNHVR